MSKGASEWLSLTVFILIVCGAVWYWAVNKDRMIREADFDQHFEDVQNILEDERY